MGRQEMYTEFCQRNLLQKASARQQAVTQQYALHRCTEKSAMVTTSNTAHTFMYIHYKHVGWL
jgi:hypothetical protein